MTAPRHERHAIASAEHLFTFFLNTQYQGARFTWEGFPEMVAGLVESSLGSAYSHLPADLEAKEQLAMDIARQRARALMEAHPGPLPTLIAPEGA